MKKGLTRDGKLICEMAAILSSGIMSNPSYNNVPINPDDMVRMAVDIIHLVMANDEFTYDKEFT